MLTAILATSALFSGFVSAEEPSEEARRVGAYTQEIEAMRSILQTERKILVMREMALTSEEAEVFWPLYDEYNAAKKEVGDLRVAVIAEYAANYGSMTDEIAADLLKDSLKFETSQIKLKKKYVRKFRKILSDVKVARYFQLENKLDAIVDYDLAAQIPLVD